MSLRGTFAALATTAALAGGGLVLTAPAEAAPLCDPWGATGTAGDIGGAYAHGDMCIFNVDNRPSVDVYLKDTVADGKSACVQLHATYADGGIRDEWVYNSGGAGSEKHASYTFASNLRGIWVREGLGKGGVCTVMAPGVHTIYKY
ncbi:hypothetical protein [Streptomyces sp. NRRL S-340]|uniref:hypothetical protein n=1 Tax=Streptomyces sp. NRRL S-340 TaxID=1463901 RepID=UPI000563A97C|nr:hypothetical protein [Streptomyces sp. NRRL S-340]